MFKRLLLSLLLLVSGCPGLKPTPLLIGDLVAANNEVHVLYNACVHHDPSCDQPRLEGKIRETQEKAKNFIAADIRQPQGYDIYLEVSLISISATEASKSGLTEAERIARQFFEVQKASSGRGLTEARYYWALFLAEYAAWKVNNNDLPFSEDEKISLRLCYAEGNIALHDLEPGPKKVRLHSALEEILLPVINSL